MNRDRPLVGCCEVATSFGASEEIVLIYQMGIYVKLGCCEGTLFKEPTILLAVCCLKVSTRFDAWSSMVVMLTGFPVITMTLQILVPLYIIGMRRMPIVGRRRMLIRLFITVTCILLGIINAFHFIVIVVAVRISCTSPQRHQIVRIMLIIFPVPVVTLALLMHNALHATQEPSDSGNLQLGLFTFNSPRQSIQ